MRKLKPEDLENILRDKMAEILALVEAIAAHDMNWDLALASLVEGEQEVVRIAIVEKMRELLEERDAEKAQALDKVIAQQKQLIAAQQKNIFERWLVWVMSEETLRKIRESFTRPFVQQRVEHEGEELSRKGVIGMNIQQPIQGMEVSRRELGYLVANVSAALGQAKGKGQGRQ